MKYKPTKLQGQLITVMLVVFSMKKKLIIMNIYLGLLNEVKLKFFRKKEKTFPMQLHCNEAALGRTACLVTFPGK